MAKSIFGKVVKATLGIAAVAGAAAAAGIAYGLKKWAEDDDSKDIKITTGTKNGLHISKTEDGKYVVDTKYDWASDPHFCEDQDEDFEDGSIIIDISGDKCCCEDDEEEPCTCGCEEEDDDEPCSCGCEEEKTEE